MNLRCSALPLFFSCPSSQREGWSEIADQPGDGAKLGTCVHECLAEFVRHAHDPGVWLGLEDFCVAAAKVHRVDRDDVMRLVNYGISAWSDIGSHFQSGLVEVDLGTQAIVRGRGKKQGISLSGHVDLCSREDLADWKSGWKEASNSEWQIRGYCRLGGFKGGWLVWLRQKELEYIPAMLDKEFDAAVKEQAEKIGTVYSPGGHCEYCRGRVECTARNAEMRAAVNTLAMVATGGTAGPLTLREKIAKVYQYLSQIEKMVDGCRALARALAKEAPIDLGNGKVLAIHAYCQSRIDPQRAWPVLAEMLTDEELAGCVEITKGSVEDAIKDKAPQGKRGEAWVAAWKRLRDAGAVEELPREKIAVRQIEGTVANA